jgi:hypothetical protein
MNVTLVSYQKVDLWWNCLHWALTIYIALYYLLHDDKIKKNFGNKLRTYRLYKNNISLEPYLSMKNDEQRILLSKLRISNHNLEIERGRHRGLSFLDECNFSIISESWFMMKLSSLDINHINCSLISKCVDDALSLNLLQGSLYLSKLLITKLYIHMYLYVMYVKSNQSNHTN